MTRYLRTEMVPLDQLTPFPGNARRGRVDVIKGSIEKNGQYRSLIVRQVENGPLVVLAGNHTMAAIGELDGTQARCEIIECDDATARRINLVDNRSNDLAEDDDEALTELLRGLEGDYDGTGYTESEANAYLGELADVLDPGPQISGDIEVDEPMPEEPERIVTAPGDVWSLGSHRLMCGDCRDSGAVSALLDGTAVNLAFTSPPYASQRDYDEASGFKPIKPDDYVEWFRPVADNVREHLADDGSWFVNIKASADGLDTHLYVHDLVVAHARQWGWHYVTELCWRRIGVPKSVTRRFKNQFEPIFQFARGDFKMRPEQVRHESGTVPVPGGPGSGNTSWRTRQGTHDAVNGKPLKGKGAGPAMSGVQGAGGDQGIVGLRPRKGKKVNGSIGEDAGGGGHTEGRVTESGLAYPGNMLPTFSGDHQATGHAAAFPVGLPQWFVLAYTDAGDAVYDPFCGSGSTLLACEREGRTGYGMEISPKYCDWTAKRFQAVTGTVPLLNGEPYDLST
jgi:DNA modification methylase